MDKNAVTYPTVPLLEIVPGTWDTETALGKEGRETPPPCSLLGGEGGGEGDLIKRETPFPTPSPPPFFGGGRLLISKEEEEGRVGPWRLVPRRGVAEVEER